MKRFILTSLAVALAAASNWALAQSEGSYQDDIYGIPPKKEVRQHRAATEAEQPYERNTASDDAGNNAAPSQGDAYSAGNNWGTEREYQDQYSYSDYDLNDDYYYASRIRRFYYPYYGQPYWSLAYDPYWYNPYWVDPYWGWSPWSQGFGISFGYGPSWNSYWGWSAWYGCSNFGSYYSYPYYGYGGYYSGYWNGYYAGLYDSYNGGNYFPSKTVTYGPRYNLRPQSAPGLRGGNGISTFRASAPARPVMTGMESPRTNSYSPRTEERPSNFRNEAYRNDAGIGSAQPDDRPVRNGWSETPAGRDDIARPDAAPARPERNAWYEQSRPQRGYQQQIPSNAATPSREFSRPAPVQREQPAAPARSFERNNNFGGGERRSSGFEGGFGGSRNFGGSGGSHSGFGGGGHRR